MSRIFSDDTFGLEKAQAKQPDDDDDQDEDDEDASSMLDRIPVIPTAHAKDAVDYSDIQETAQDDFSEKYYHRGMGMVQKNLPKSRLALVTDNYDEDEEEEEEAAVAKPITQISIKQEAVDQVIPSLQQQPYQQQQPTMMEVDHEQKVDIQQLFPGFEKGKILKFSELFMAKIKRPPKLVPLKRG
jgi:hypothetical protein